MQFGENAMRVTNRTGQQTMTAIGIIGEGCKKKKGREKRTGEEQLPLISGRASLHLDRPFIAAVVASVAHRHAHRVEAVRTPYEREGGGGGRGDGGSEGKGGKEGRESEAGKT